MGRAGLSAIARNYFCPQTLGLATYSCSASPLSGEAVAWRRQEALAASIHVKAAALAHPRDKGRPKPGGWGRAAAGYSCTMPWMIMSINR